MTHLLSKNYCTILGISQDASLWDIKKAYRKKAKEYHPDLNKAENAHFQFIIINEAYSFLLNERTVGPFESSNTRGQNKRHDSSRSKSRQSKEYEEWVKSEKAKARSRAKSHANMNYEDFKKSSFYKTSKIISETVDYIYLTIGIIILLVPIVYTALYGIDHNNIARSITAIFMSLLVGSVFIIMISMSKLKAFRRRVVQKKERAIEN